ncbi:hypothetical protein [Dysgonomonas sp. 521]|uniref:hypothetical protein n=1 Tax=Dysgonomonas sp. 521 TaxID=2302932 RepID=UPI001C88B5F9|nr:hypothetical protein [Dysgonomonas sp. 521]
MKSLLSYPGECQICGCTETSACYHPDYGNCWWVDENQDLCSHCADASYENSIAAMMLAEKHEEY